MSTAGRTAAGGRFSLCAPAKTGAAVGAVTGLIVWALVAFVPAFHNGVPQPVTDVLPFVLAFLGHVITAWAVPDKRAAPAVPAASAGSAGITGTMPSGTRP